MENVGHGWSQVNQRVLKEAPCTMAVLVDRDLTLRVVRNVCVLLLGGPTIGKRSSWRKDRRAPYSEGGHNKIHPESWDDIHREFQGEKYLVL